MPIRQSTWRGSHVQSILFHSIIYILIFPWFSIKHFKIELERKSSQFSHPDAWGLYSNFHTQDSLFLANADGSMLDLDQRHSGTLDSGRSCPLRFLSIAGCWKGTQRNIILQTYCIWLCKLQHPSNLWAWWCFEGWKRMQHLWLPDLVRFSFDDAPKIEFDSTEPKDAAHLLSEVRRHLLAEMLLVSGSMWRWNDWIWWDLWCDVWGRKARQWFWMKHFHDNFIGWSGSSLSAMCVSIWLTVSFLLNIY